MFDLTIHILERKLKDAQDETNAVIREVCNGTVCNRQEESNDNLRHGLSVRIRRAFRGILQGTVRGMACRNGALNE